MSDIQEKPIIYFLAKYELDGYADDTEPNLYPSAFQKLVKIQDYESLQQKLSEAEARVKELENAKK